jgi:CDP-glucose 4,6-dehydratase
VEVVEGHAVTSPTAAEGAEGRAARSPTADEVVEGRAVTSPTAEELRRAFSGKRVLLTGHTGFKGGWLLTWLEKLGAVVSGLSLPAEPKALFTTAELISCGAHHEGDIRSFEMVKKHVEGFRPEVVFHLAAQALVRRSYAEPLETLQSNVNGTAHVLEAIRKSERPCAVIVVSSDKCYENREWVFGYRENEAMGGYDPYSMSKGATELVTSAWRRSYFPPSKLSDHGVALASARAGNVIGGGDFAEDRIVPDAIRALDAGQPIEVRNPRSVRPWQHVLEPLGGYLLLGARLLGVGTSSPAEYCDGWNFGPRGHSARPVSALVDEIVKAWGSGSWIDRSDASARHEAALLRLSIDKAQAYLNWQPRWGFEETVARTVAWYKAQASGVKGAKLKALMLEDIAGYELS